MVIDKLENLEKYYALNPLFKEVAAFLAENDVNALPTGIHKIKGDDLFVNIQEAKGKTRDEAVIEYHRKLIDIQIPLSCAEVMGYTPRQYLPKAEYDAAKDITFYLDRPEQYITVHPGEFVIFFPEDGHAPGISPVPEYKKVIFKVKA